MDKSLCGTPEPAAAAELKHVESSSCLRCQIGSVESDDAVVQKA